MKIAVRQIAVGSCLLALSLVTGSAAFYSMAEAMPADNSTAAAGAAASAPPAPTPIPAAAPEVKLPDLSTPLPGDKKDAKLNDPVNVKVPDSVKDAIKKLNLKSDDITLDDLNTAREAVAKLDALIDIEKRLVDLDKIKAEHEESNKNALMAALPASALTPPPAYMPPPMNQEIRPMPTPVFTPPPSTVDIERIEGSNRHYAALIKEGDNTRLVHPGDKLNDGSTVLSVTLKGIELQRGDKAARLVAIKDVQTVFGSSP